MKNQSGQALITLLFFIIFTVTVTTSAIVVLFTTSMASSNNEQSTIAYSAAESGIENALIRILRNPAYSGEIFQIGSNQVTVQITPGNPLTILSTGESGNSSHQIQAQIVYNNNTYSITSWKEIY